MSQSTTVQALRAPAESSMPLVTAGFFNLQGFELIQRVAKAFSQSSLVPQAYQNNLPNCMIAMDMAQRIGANPLMVMQNLYIVHGTPGWSSKFLIATINVCGRFSTLRYEWKGKPGEADYGCRAWAIEKETGERLDGIWVTWAMVNAEGWASKNGSKWKTMPDQMFIYRSAAFWQRAYAPELGMGLTTQEELVDTLDARTGPDGAISVDVDALRAQAADKATVERSVTGPKHADATDVEVRETGEVLDTSPAKAQAEAGKPAQGAATAAPASQEAGAQGTDEGGLDPAKVENQINAAKDLEVLDLAGDSIDGVTDMAERARLHDLYQEKRIAMARAAQTQPEGQAAQPAGQRPATTQRRRMAAPE
ncbi:hypothetical protein [Bordetella sp. BOR01]|uniref:hypothetical protein n=1 Tax=Bordetella sp. BOR01 TaxID=2854779 RepID=UPI001C48BED9|nr:hypothetical protein [Bordetella sp. BOR01]MBV7482487.1 hypothetical protein [Bordetella sp. BOR01]